MQSLRQGMQHVTEQAPISLLTKVLADLSIAASMSAHHSQNGFAARCRNLHWRLLPCEVAVVLAAPQCSGVRPGLASWQTYNTQS